jgi:hypothetical protein
MLKYASQCVSKKSTLYLTFGMEQIPNSEWKELNIRVRDESGDIKIDPNSLLLAAISATASCNIGRTGVFEKDGELCCSLFVKPLSKANVPVNVVDVHVDDEDNLPADEEDLRSKYENIGKPS